MNYLYGILTNGIVEPDTPGYRYTDCFRKTDAHKKLNTLMGNKPIEIAAKADFIIKIMRSSPSWVSFIKEYDPVNTYEEAVYPAKGILSTNFYEDIKKWVNTLNINSTKYPISNHDDQLQKIINSFYIVATSK